MAREAIGIDKPDLLFGEYRVPKKSSVWPPELHTRMNSPRGYCAQFAYRLKGLDISHRRFDFKEEEDCVILRANFEGKFKCSSRSMSLHPGRTEHSQEGRVFQLDIEESDIDTFIFYLKEEDHV